MTKRDLTILHLIAIGYSVSKEGILLKTGIASNAKFIDNWGYLNIKTKIKGKNVIAAVHRIQAYQKYGIDIFDRSKEVRHIDGNKLNNSYDNIVLGTHSENMFDVPKEIRDNRSELGATKTRKFSEDEIKIIKREKEMGASLRDLSLKYKCCKSTMSYIVNGKTYKKYCKTG